MRPGFHAGGRGDFFEFPKQKTMETGNGMVQAATVDHGPSTVQAIVESHTPNGEQADRNFKTLQLVVFKLKDEEFALRIEQIKEVVLTPKVTQVPQTSNYVRGVANIRGNILAIVDLEERFGLVSEGDSRAFERFTLVLDDREYKVGILVSNVPNTIEVPEDALDESPNIVYNNVVDERAIEAIAKVDDRLIILLDIKRVLGSEDFSSIVGKPESN